MNGGAQPCKRDSGNVSLRRLRKDMIVNTEGVSHKKIAAFCSLLSIVNGTTFKYWFTRAHLLYLDSSISSDLFGALSVYRMIPGAVDFMGQERRIFVQEEKIT